MLLAPRDKAEITSRKDAEQTPAIQPSTRVSPLGSGMVPHVDVVGQTPSASPSLAELRGSL